MTDSDSVGSTGEEAAGAAFKVMALAETVNTAIPESKTPDSSEGSPPKAMPGWQKVIREVFCFSLWALVLLKLFVFDLDVWVIQRYFPSFSWVLDFKFAFVLGIMALLVIFWRLHLLWRWLGYTAFYPIVLAARVPIWIVRTGRWTLGVALVALVASALRSFRVNFLIGVAFALGTILCALTWSPWLLIPGAILTAAALLTTYWRTIAAAFRPSLDALSEKALGVVWKLLQGTANSVSPTPTDLDVMTESERTTWISNLQLVVIYNRGCYFLADKLREIKRSNLSSAIYILRLLAAFAVTVWTFFLLNFTLYKLNSTAYAAPADVRGFDFFYYSFNSLFANYSSGGIEPVSVLARSLAMSATAAVALVFAVVLVFVVTSLYKSRDDNQMDTLARSIKEHAESIEPFIDEHYGMTVGEAVVKLEELRAGLIGVIYFFSPTMRPESPPQAEEQGK